MTSGKTREEGAGANPGPAEKVPRPWGYFVVLEESGDGYKVKRFLVRPGRRLSLQRHRHRSEHWFIVRGAARITRGEESIASREGDSIDIPTGAVHRIENTGTTDLIVVEVQQGDYLGEDDIERLEDDFGR